MFLPANMANHRSMEDDQSHFRPSRVLPAGVVLGNPLRIGVGGRRRSISIGIGDGRTIKPLMTFSVSVAKIEIRRSDVKSRRRVVAIVKGGALKSVGLGAGDVHPPRSFVFPARVRRLNPNPSITGMHHGRAF